MRVLHIQKVTGIGGSERHLLALLPALAARNVDVGICVLTAGDASGFIEELRRLGITSIDVAAGHRVNPALVTKLAARMRDFHPDLVHTHLIQGDLYGQLSARLLGIPGISTMHGPRSFYRREPYRTTSRISGRLARRKIAISEYLASFVRELRLAPPGRIEVIPYGICADDWGLPPGARAKARQTFGLTPDDVAVGIAARLIQGKGHAMLFEALNLAGAETANLRLLVAGVGPLRSELEATAASSNQPGRIRFLGFVEDVQAFMNACDVLAFPTLPELGEGFGLAALEAMAVGRPVLATAVTSLPELVVDGETGLLVSPSSPHELSQALVRLAADRAFRERLGEAGTERARSMFGIDLMVDRTIAVYESVLDEKVRATRRPAGRSTTRG